MFMRFVRVLAAVLTSGVAVQFADSQWLMLAGPLVAATAKKLREKDPARWGWLPV